MKSTAFLVVGVLGIGLWWLLQRDPVKPEAPREQKETQVSVSASEGSGPLYLDLDDLPKSPAKRSQLADQLNQPAGTPEKDLQVLKAIFRHYRSAYRENPIGNHEQILKRLIGNNPNGVFYIPENHPAIADGQLRDRWGTPFYFHQIAKDIMEIRSAGPDGRHWNSDDLTIR